MKVLHVIHSLDPRSGGPSHAIREMIRAQVAQGTECALLANTVQSAEPWLSPDEYADRINRDPALQQAEVKLARSYGRRPPWVRFAWSPEVAPWLRQRLRDRGTRPDVIHIHGTFAHVTTAAAAAARAARVPYIIRPTGALDAHCYASGRARLKRFFSWLLLNKDVQRAALIHATSEAEAQVMHEWTSPENVRVIPLGIDPAVFDSRPDPEVLWARFPQLRGRRTILFLSRVAPKKRAELLAEALALLVPEFPDLALLVAGQDAGGMPALDAAITRHGLAERVVKAGFLEGVEKQAAFVTAAVFALPSLDENFGVSVVEAMSFGAPVLVTPGVASHVYVDASGCGATVAGSPTDVADGIRQLLQSDRQEIGGRGRDFVARQLTWPAIVRQLDDMYHAAIDRTSVAGELRR